MLSHTLRVTLAGRRRLDVACRPIRSRDLAERVMHWLVELLAAEDVEFVAAPRWAFAARDAIEAAAADRLGCMVELVERRVTRAGKRSRVVLRIAVSAFAGMSPPARAA